ncbi:uncharacterized protein si:ch211-126c2.4 isoform X2 [Pseudorasbora parva]|uniref:uncharacterized protein si:ch211-126c2.4 isoform X2 n=1 Tax=Pseudorasbora parva TaxID=51549 RepID=UPI00351E1516
MESFLRRKLAQAGGNISDEPFPQVSGFLDDTVGPSFLSNEAGTVLNSPACTPSENQTKNKDEGDLASRKEAAIDSSLNCSLEGCSQLTDGSMSARSLQKEKDISDKDEGVGHCKDPVVFTTSLEKSDIMSGSELKNSTFDVNQDLKKQSDASVNVTVDLNNVRGKNSTFESQESKERSDPRLNSTVDIVVPNTKTESGNTTVDLVQSHDPKESPITGANTTVDIPNIDSAHSKTNSFGDNTAPLNTTTEQVSEKLEGTIDIQPQAKPNGSLSSAEDDKIKNAEEVSVTVNIVEQMASAPHQPSSEIEQSSSDILKPAKMKFTKHNTTTVLSPSEVPVLKDTVFEMKPSSTELANQVNCASNSLGITKSASNITETDVERNTSAFVCSVDDPSDAPELKAEEHHTQTERPGLAEVEFVPSSDMGNISRNSIFCLDDTLDMKTSFMVTSTPIVFGREPRFDILRDAKPTPMRKRLSVINSIEVQSNDELVGVSNHNGTDVVQATESSSQKVSVNCISSHSTSEPANENKPPTKPAIKRHLPKLSSKISYPKSSLPPRPQPSMNSSVAIKPKTIQGPQHPETSSSTLLANRKLAQMNKGKNIAPVKNTALASTVKTSLVSPVTGYNFTAVAKPSSVGIPQIKPSGLQPPTRKRLALKTPQTTRSSVETFPTQPINKPTTGLPGMRTRNSLLPSVGQTHLNNDGLPSAKRKRIAHAPLSTVESGAVHPAEEAHASGCANCLQHQAKLERVLQELMGLRSECKNWGPLHEKLEMCLKEMKRI